MSKTQVLNQIGSLSRERDELLTLLDRAVNPQLEEAIGRELKIITKQAEKLEKKLQEAN